MDKGFIPDRPGIHEIGYLILPRGLLCRIFLADVDRRLSRACELARDQGLRVAQYIGDGKF
jgi:hypothetical protein